LFSSHRIFCRTACNIGLQFGPRISSTCRTLVLQVPSRCLRGGSVEDRRSHWSTLSTLSPIACTIPFFGSRGISINNLLVLFSSGRMNQRGRHQDLSRQSQGGTCRDGVLYAFAYEIGNESLSLRRFLLRKRPLFRCRPVACSGRQSSAILLMKVNPEHV